MVQFLPDVYSILDNLDDVNNINRIDYYDHTAVYPLNDRVTLIIPAGALSDINGNEFNRAQLDVEYSLPNKTVQLMNAPMGLWGENTYEFHQIMWLYFSVDGQEVKFKKPITLIFTGEDSGPMEVLTSPSKNARLWTSRLKDKASYASYTVYGESMDTKTYLGYPVDIIDNNMWIGLGKALLTQKSKSLRVQASSITEVEGKALCVYINVKKKCFIIADNKDNFSFAFSKIPVDEVEGGKIYYFLPETHEFLQFGTKNVYNIVSDSIELSTMRIHMNELYAQLRD